MSPTDFLNKLQTLEIPWYGRLLDFGVNHLWNRSRNEWIEPTTLERKFLANLIFMKFNMKTFIKNL